ncbi:SusC/RagA family TonB-linked outer membrane protein [Flavobacterium sp. 7A]|uniref:SusC/RagA family TonB-linked outer membrane protein n=1 Tax=Flavobacterium sp. 7A TaxID=2940571 RepID=UPI002225B913|nr:TonB-dependent receptor [Flavobacterium sp. 7A]MCW2119020.1 TonB-linked SusC/RagA family outer membrane protein [Flavobacterium sp. 7A]
MKIREIIKQKNALGRFLFLTLLALFFNVAAHAQVGVVQGKVVGDEDGFPIPGVSIVVKGSAKGTATDFDGKFTIKANDGDLLTFTYIGLRTVNVKAVKGMTVKMKSVAQDLSEVVVIGYGTQKKKEITGAVASIKAEDISNIVTSDLGNALQGQISGVNVVSSGEPGTPSEILIRGVTSIIGGNTPLYVVDGIPQEGDPGIAPSEVETIDVLKDAASAAIYGTRGAAGVILITTKKGKAGSMSVRVDASRSFDRLGSAIPLLNARNQTYTDVLLQRNDGTKDDAIGISNFVNSPDRFQYDNNVSRLLFVDNASTQNYNVNVSGGSKDLKYSMVAGFYDRNGVILKSNFNRFNTRSNVNYKKNKLTIDLGIGITKESNNRGAANTIQQLIRYQPTQPLLDPNADQVDTFGGADQNTNTSIVNSLNISDITKSTRSFGNISLGYELLKGLHFTTRAGFNDFYSNRSRFIPFQSFVNAQTGVAVNNPISSYVENQDQRRTSINWDASLNYETRFNKDHHLTLTAATSREHYQNNQFTANKRTVVDNDIQVFNGATGVANITSGPDYVTRLAGYIGRMQYDYKGKYLISSSIRRDGSSRFAAQNRWGLFPSVSAAWNVSDEPFFKPLSNVINNFKIRLSNGTVGNQSFDDYSYTNTIYRDLVYPFATNSTASIQNSLGNPDVKWETSVQKNFGIDLGLFKNKLTISAEYYETNKNDMLFQLSLPGSTGLNDTSNGAGFSVRPLSNNNQVVLNVGNMTNKGFELAVGFRDKIGKLKYRMNGTFTTNKNVVTNTATDTPYSLTTDSGIVPGAGANSTLTSITAIAKGYEAGAFFIRKTNGLVDTPEKLAAYQLIVPGAKMGDLIYIDQNNDKKIDDQDRVYGGSGLPKFEIGYNLSLDYNNFDLYVNAYAAVGQEIVNGSRATAIALGRSEEILNSYSDANPTGKLPAYRGTFLTHDNYLPISDLFIEDGSYLRIRNITLGYSLSKKTLKSIGVDKFRIYLTGQNLFTFTKYTGYDPEVGGNVSRRGLDKGNYPFVKSYLLGLNFNF